MTFIFIQLQKHNLLQKTQPHFKDQYSSINSLGNLAHVKVHQLLKEMFCKNGCMSRHVHLALTILSRLADQTEQTDKRSSSKEMYHAV